MHRPKALVLRYTLLDYQLLRLVGQGSNGLTVKLITSHRLQQVKQLTSVNKIGHLFITCQSLLGLVAQKSCPLDKSFPLYILVQSIQVSHFLSVNPVDNILNNWTLMNFLRLLRQLDNCQGDIISLFFHRPRNLCLRVKPFL